VMARKPPTSSSTVACPTHVMVTSGCMSGLVSDGSR
jgi:hypothetical protein